LSDEDWFVRLAAAQALKNFGERARPAVPALIGALSISDWVKDFRPVRCGEAMVTLSRVAPEVKELEVAYRMIASTMLEDERHSSFGAKARGARLLGDCGPAARATLPALTKLLKDADGDARIAAAEALLKIAPGQPAEAALAALSEALQDPSLLLRLRSAEALGGRGAQAKSVLPLLRAALQDPEPEVRQAAAAAIQKIAP
ncbi:MAG: HEAT repeat domain-containing protein, partial [Planctomycetaceae bacterium]|nr:HEAT repeat domain-containing protein [Planctomycetaceae bacterium]